MSTSIQLKAGWNTLGVPTIILATVLAAPVQGRAQPAGPSSKPGAAAPKGAAAAPAKATTAKPGPKSAAVPKKRQAKGLRPVKIADSELPGRTVPQKARTVGTPTLYRVKNRYHWAVPTALSAAAGIFLGIGVGILFKGRSDIKDLRNDVNDFVRQYGTSVPYTYPEGKRDKAVNMQIAGYALMGVAAGTAVTGAVLWLVRRKLVRYRPRITISKKSGSVQLTF